MKRTTAIALAGIATFVLLLGASQEDCKEASTISLNGDWQLYAGSHPGEYKYTVQVPGLVDLAKPKLKWEKYPYFFYKKNFDLDQDWLSKYSRAWLKIDGSFWGTMVWINGNYVGQSYRCFAPIEFEVSKFLKNKDMANFDILPPHIQ